MKISDIIAENFADGRNPQDKGDSKRYNVPTKASVSTLRKVAKQGGRKGQLAHWMANMKAGKAKKEMRVNELFGKLDTTKTWEWEYFDDNNVGANLTVGEISYKFSAFQDADEAPGNWEVEFITTSDKVPAGRSQFGITGTGRSSEVFSTVVDILRDFVNKKKRKIRSITFAAKEGSRQDLYARMAKRLLPSWEFEQNGPNFVLTRPDLTWWVYSVEPPYNKIPAIKILAPSAAKAQEKAIRDLNSAFKGADPMGIAVKSTKPRR